LYHNDIKVIYITHIIIEVVMDGIQLDIFEKPKTDMDIMRDEVRIVKMTLDKVRRGTYAQLGEYYKLVMNQQEEIDQLKRKVCR
jgi:uncharacterized protein Yka (UPF0111/DUF47 family)